MCPFKRGEYSVDNVGDRFGAAWLVELVTGIAAAMVVVGATFVIALP